MKNINYIAYAADGSYFVTVSSTKEQDYVTLWNPETGEAFATFEPEGEGITGLACSPNNRYILCCDMGGFAMLWEMDKRNVTNFQQIPIYEPDIGDDLYNVGFSTTSEIVFIGGGGLIFGILQIGSRKSKTFWPIFLLIPFSRKMIDTLSFWMKGNLKRWTS